LFRSKHALQLRREIGKFCPVLIHECTMSPRPLAVN
jgi:hypothetical protein